VFLAVVDTSAGADFLELVKLALAATLDALPPNALVGIVTVSDSVRPCTTCCVPGWSWCSLLAGTGVCAL
jgi:Sec23/Sec24 trunk domain